MGKRLRKYDIDKDAGEPNNISVRCDYELSQDPGGPDTICRNFAEYVLDGNPYCEQHAQSGAFYILLNDVEEPETVWLGLPPKGAE